MTGASTDGQKVLAAHRFRQMLAELVDRPIRLMEVCGTHSQAIGRFGLRQLLPADLRLLSGPGCPVCVTTPGEISAMIALATSGVIVCTFGDMMRVPGHTDNGSAPPTLSLAKAQGADVRVVYSPLQAVEIAQAHPDREVVFLGVGFETTAPAVAAAVLSAARQQVPNLSVFAAHKLVPPALVALLQSPGVALDGLLCPGHVSTIIGAQAYVPLVQQYRIPCAVAGFAPAEIMAGILSLVRQVRTGEARVDNDYARAVRPEGNPLALRTMYEVFRPADATWRGLGTIADSGLAFREAYRHFDAAARHGVEVAVLPEPPGCCCGAVLRGALSPRECPSFGDPCRPESPVGPCMVSSEGSCAAEWRYGQPAAEPREVTA